MLRFILSILLGFPKEIRRVYPFYEFCYSEKSKYTLDLWRKKQLSWDVGCVLPMLRKNGRIAYYKITKNYYDFGGSHSDWACGDDGKYRDMVFHHIKKEVNDRRS